MLKVVKGSVGYNHEAWTNKSCWDREEDENPFKSQHYTDWHQIFHSLMEAAAKEGEKEVKKTAGQFEHILEHSTPRVFTNIDINMKLKAIYTWNQKHPLMSLRQRRKLYIYNIFLESFSGLVSLEIVNYKTPILSRVIWVAWDILVLTDAQIVSVLTEQ